MLHQTHESGSAARLRAIYDALPDMVLVVDRAGYVREVHVGAGLEGRLAADEVLDAHLKEILPAGYVDDRVADLARIFEQGTYVTQYWSSFAGVKRFVELHGSVLDEDHALVVQRDITAARETFEELRASQTHLRAIYDAFPDVISITDRDGIIVEVSPGDMKAPAGMGRRDVVGHSFTEFLASDDVERLSELQQRALGGEIATTEYELMVGDARRWVETCGARLDDDHVLWVARDVTNRRRAEVELRASEDRYRNIVETAAEGIMALDASYRFTFVNERAEEILGYAHGELLGVHVREILPEARVTMADEARSRRATGIAERFEGQLVRRDGSLVWVLISARPRYDDAGNFAGSFSMVADISDLKHAEAERQRLLRRVGAAEDDERRRLAEGLHDGPIQDLAAMALRLGTLRLGLFEDEERSTRIREIEEAIRTTIGDLRDVMFALQPAELGADGLASSLRTCASVVFGDDANVVEVNAHLDDEPPPRVASTMYRIAREALVNARRHANAKHIVLDVATVDAGVALEVSDDGVGIPDEILEHGVAGHLGLRMMRERAAAEGGTCIFESDASGTRVVVWLPLDADRPSRDLPRERVTPGARSRY